MWAASATYTTAHGNTGSSTHWAWPGIEPVSSWMLVRLVSTESWWEFPIGFFSSMLFSLHVISFFSFLFLWLIYSFMSLWSEKILEIISILFYLLRLVLCPSMWSILENVLCALEKMVHFDFFGCNVLKMSIKSKFLLCHLGSLLPYWFLSRRSVHLCERGVKISYYYWFPSLSPFM